MTGSNPTGGRPGDDRAASSGEPGMTSKSGRRRGRVLVPAVILGVIAVIFIFMLLVGQLGR